MKSRIGISALALVAAISSFSCKPKSSSSGPVESSGPKIKVDTVTIGEQKVPKLLELTGVLSSNERTDLAANASGRVTKTFVERGDHVQQGQLLAQLDARSAALSSAEANANVTSATEQLAGAKADCDRYVNLLARGAITQQEYDNKATSCKTQAASEEAARARAAQASQTVSDSAIRAPFTGLIAERFVHVGDYVHPDTRVVTLLVDDPLRLELTIPEANLGSVHQGTVVTFRSVGLPGRTFNGLVKYLGGEIREATRDLVVEAVTDNKDRALLPGMFVTADIPVGEVTSPVVPEKSLIHRDESTVVLLVVSGHLEEHIVQTGATLGDQVAITDGVKTGDVVVVSPPPNATDGAEVQQ